MDKFAERLKELRLERGLTQLQLAKAVSLSKSAIGHWENRTREPGASAIIIFAKYFGVSADYLLGLED